jgi:DNA-binding CsgD family transcriptional regulator
MKLRDSPVTEDDLHTFIHVLGEIASMRATASEKRTQLMCQVARQLNSDSWLWGVIPPIIPSKPQSSNAFHSSGGIDTERIALTLKAIETPENDSLRRQLSGTMTDVGAQLSGLHQQLINDEGFLNSAASPLWRAANIGPILISIRPISGDATSVVAFYRQPDAPPFTTREVRIAHIFLTEVPWLHEIEPPHFVVCPPRLPPRCRLILKQLLCGQPRKEIAAELGLSIHTVNDYLKQIFRYFGVHAQTELIVRLRNGQGHDISA